MNTVCLSFKEVGGRGQGGGGGTLSQLAMHFTDTVLQDRCVLEGSWPYQESTLSAIHFNSHAGEQQSIHTSKSWHCSQACKLQTCSRTITGM